MTQRFSKGSVTETYCKRVQKKSQLHDREQKKGFVNGIFEKGLVNPNKKAWKILGSFGNSNWCKTSMVINNEGSLKNLVILT